LKKDEFNPWGKKPREMEGTFEWEGKKTRAYSKTEREGVFSMINGDQKKVNSMITNWGKNIKKKRGKKPILVRR